MSLATTRRPPALAGEIEHSRLANGLELALVVNRQAPIVASALFYRVGARDEEPGSGGVAHFLEHLMFKGSERYAAGEIDRRTQELGGSNNAFTSHDVTAYWFTFAADRWPEALAIEADRMRGLRLEPDEIDAERRVILEELAMYRDEPWDALEMEVLAALFPGHPYGRPVLGSAGELRATGRETLAAFHHAAYRPGNAVLVVAGDLDRAAARSAIEDAFGDLAGGALERASAPPLPRLAAARRIERRHGEVPRLLWALPAPPASDPDHGALRLLATLLAAGRASRLQRSLVEERELCLSVSATVAENAWTSWFSIAAELLPGVDPTEVERRIAAELGELATEPVGAEELERARQVFLADWAYGQERIHQQAVGVGMALALFNLGQPERLLSAALAAEPETLCRLAARWLDVEGGGVLGRSLAEG